ncbi:hypothetical protein RR21198_4628 [Rhodococcus rhodochrous ATCC 21198]|uniref:hypothetical protein n=1 Tax=Rhodococcus TaxID=1827 RepID=UPI0003E2986E|nr:MULTISPECIES: hypothetical protein [Rhodococcus]ETT24545.1 hypothetical protein RR21198_4628 [Rhodococcus rhodochrous ATCC 21198]KDE10220.1 hypothetical protein N505_0127415 [Rhodococcus aetherivorans]MDV6296035.1 hypothetical protein [Rhodococcus aetherivorans]NGP27787.1 hypothetical protein [Rhodococcus aetherivorans]QIX48574.1 hypothetical protein HFP48_02715 [Rhodococcus sp. DMU1]
MTAATDTRRGISEHVGVNEASGAENEPMPSEAKDFGPLFHDTKADLQPGDLLKPPLAHSRLFAAG